MRSSVGTESSLPAVVGVLVGALSCASAVLTMNRTARPTARRTKRSAGLACSASRESCCQESSMIVCMPAPCDPKTMEGWQAERLSEPEIGCCDRIGWLAHFVETKVNENGSHIQGAGGFSVPARARGASL